jgi:hypothetical protein
MYTLEHGYYGCESGCCGMRLCEGASDDDEYDEYEGRWSFMHPPHDGSEADVVEWARDEFDLGAGDTIRLGEWRCV